MTTDLQQAPIAIVMLSLNEGHNIREVVENLKGFAQEIFLVDSYSSDETVSEALELGVHVVQRRFRNFGDQWNFALEELPITAAWTMKIDPDERLTHELKASLRQAINADRCDAIEFDRQLFFMGEPLPIRQRILRAWKTGSARFTDVAVNEHPIVEGKIIKVSGEMEHHDSPHLHHWYEKQNKYTTMEAMTAFTNAPMAAKPNLFGKNLERRVWLKLNFHRIPMSYQMLSAYYFFIEGAWKAGRVGWVWSRLRGDVHRAIDTKRFEMEKRGRAYSVPQSALGPVDKRCKQYEN